MELRIKLRCRSLGLSILVIVTQVINTNIGSLDSNTCCMAGVPVFQTEVLYGFFFSSMKQMLGIIPEIRP